MSISALAVGRATGSHRPVTTGVLKERFRRAAQPGTDVRVRPVFDDLVRDLPPASLSAAMRRLPAEEAMRDQIVAVMNRSLTGNPTVVELTGSLGVSPRHLTSRCRELFGEAPARLYLRMKTTRAREMLRQERMRVREVSEALGFAGPFHFSRVYRRVMGRPPSADCR
jgi:transcriptional regulator GlxA family with amidase domain